MNPIIALFDFIMHIDRHLTELVDAYGVLIYALLFLIVFCETGLVVTPFLPGDSLLFAAGALAGAGAMNIGALYILFFAAAVLGDAANYWIGNKSGQTLRDRGILKFVKQKHLDQTTAFFDRHGGKTIIIARFMPIIRTLAPFVAGAGKMKYRRFFSFNVIGGFIWVTLFTFGGYFFGNLPFVQNNFTFILIAIVLISLTPPIIVKLLEMRRKAKERKETN